MKAHSRATKRHLLYGITCHPTQVNTLRACHWRRSINRTLKRPSDDSFSIAYSLATFIGCPTYTYLWSGIFCARARESRGY